MAKDMYLDEEDEQKTELNGTADTTLDTARDAANDAVETVTKEPTKVDVPKPNAVARPSEPTYSSDEMFNHLRNGTDYTMDEINAMSDSQYRQYTEIAKHRDDPKVGEFQQKMLSDRLALSDELEKKAEFVAEQTKDDKDFSEDHDNMAYSADWLRNHKTAFAKMSEDDVATVRNDIERKYDEATKRIGHWEHLKNQFAKGYLSCGNMLYQGMKMTQPGELDDWDKDQIRGTMQYEKDLEIENPQKVGGFENINSVGDFADYLSETVAGNVPRAAASMGLAVAGAHVFPVHPVAGAMLFGTLGTMWMNTGEAVQDILNEKRGGDDDIRNSRGWALLQGLGYSILDGALGVSAMGAKLWGAAMRKLGVNSVKDAVKGAGVEFAKDVVGKASLKGIGKDILVHGVIGEGVQEAAQSQIVGRGVRAMQTGSLFKRNEDGTYETPKEAWWEAANEFVGGAASGVAFGLVGGGAANIDARRTMKIHTDDIMSVVKDDQVYKKMGDYPKLLVSKALENEAYLSTTHYLDPKYMKALQKCNDDIYKEIDRLSNLKGRGNERARLDGQSAKLYLDLFKSQYDLTNINELIVGRDAQSGQWTCRDGKTYTPNIDIEGMRKNYEDTYDEESKRRLRVFTNPVAGSEVKVAQVLDEEGNPTGQYLFANDRHMKMPVFGENEIACDNLNSALERACDLDVFNQWRKDKMAAKAKVANQVFNHLFGSRGFTLNLVDRPTAGDNANATTKAGVSAQTRVVDLDLSKINNLGDLYTTLMHERTHGDIVDFLLKSDKWSRKVGMMDEFDWAAFEKDRNELFSKVVDENGRTAEEMSAMQRKPGAKPDRNGRYSDTKSEWGKSAGTAGEEMVAERGSVRKLATEQRSADRGIAGIISDKSYGLALKLLNKVEATPGSTLDRVRQTVAQKMALDMGVDPSAILPDAVASEMKHIFDSGYLGEPAQAFKREDAAVPETEGEVQNPAWGKTVPSVNPAKDEVTVGTMNTTDEAETAPAKMPKKASAKVLKPALKNGEGASYADGSYIRRADGTTFTKKDGEDGSYVWNSVDTNENVDDETATQGGYSDFKKPKATTKTAAPAAESAPVAEESPSAAPETVGTETAAPTEMPVAEVKKDGESAPTQSTKVENAPEVDKQKTEKPKSASTSAKNETKFDKAKIVAPKNIVEEYDKIADEIGGRRVDELLANENSSSGEGRDIDEDYLRRELDYAVEKMSEPDADQAAYEKAVARGFRGDGDTAEWHKQPEYKAYKDGVAKAKRLVAGFGKRKKSETQSPEPVKVGSDDAVKVEQNETPEVVGDDKGDTVTVPQEPEKAKKTASRKSKGKSSAKRWGKVLEYNGKTEDDVTSEQKSRWYELDALPDGTEIVNSKGNTFSKVPNESGTAERAWVSTGKAEGRRVSQLMIAQAGDFTVVEKKPEETKAEAPKAEDKAEEKVEEKAKVDEQPMQLSDDEMALALMDQTTDEAFEMAYPNLGKAHRDTIKELSYTHGEPKDIIEHPVFKGYMEVDFGDGTSEFLGPDGQVASVEDLAARLADSRSAGGPSPVVMAATRLSSLAQSLGRVNLSNIDANPKGYAGLSEDRLLALSVRKEDYAALNALWGRWEKKARDWFSNKYRNYGENGEPFTEKDIDNWIKAFRKEWNNVFMQSDGMEVGLGESEKAMIRVKTLESELASAMKKAKDSDDSKDKAVVQAIKDQIEFYTGYGRMAYAGSEANVKSLNHEQWRDRRKGITSLMYDLGNSLRRSGRMSSREAERDPRIISLRDRLYALNDNPLGKANRMYRGVAPLDARFTSEEMKEMALIQRIINGYKQYLRDTSKNYVDESRLDKDPFIVSMNEALRLYNPTISHFAPSGRMNEIESARSKGTENTKTLGSPLSRTVNADSLFYGIANGLWGVKVAEDRRKKVDADYARSKALSDRMIAEKEAAMLAEAERRERDMIRKATGKALFTNGDSAQILKDLRVEAYQGFPEYMKNFTFGELLDAAKTDPRARNAVSFRIGEMLIQRYVPKDEPDVKTKDADRESDVANEKAETEANRKEELFRARNEDKSFNSIIAYKLKSQGLGSEYESDVYEYVVNAINRQMANGGKNDEGKTAWLWKPGKKTDADVKNYLSAIVNKRVLQIITENKRSTGFATGNLSYDSAVKKAGSAIDASVESMRDEGVDPTEVADIDDGFLVDENGDVIKTVEDAVDGNRGILEVGPNAEKEIYGNAIRAAEYLVRSGNLTRSQSRILGSLMSAWTRLLYNAYFDLEAAKTRRSRANTIKALEDKYKAAQKLSFDDRVVEEFGAAYAGMKVKVFRSRLARLMKDINDAFVDYRERQAALRGKTLNLEEFAKKMSSGRFTRSQVDNSLAGYNEGRDDSVRYDLAELKKDMDFNGDEAMRFCVSLAEQGKSNSKIDDIISDNAEFAKLANADGAVGAKTLLKNAYEDYGWIDKRKVNTDSSLDALVGKVMDLMDVPPSVSVAGEEVELDSDEALNDFINGWMKDNGVDVSKGDVRRSLMRIQVRSIPSGRPKTVEQLEEDRKQREERKAKREEERKLEAERNRVEAQKDHAVVAKVFDGNEDFGYPEVRKALAAKGYSEERIGQMMDRYDAIETEIAMAKNEAAKEAKNEAEAAERKAAADRWMEENRKAAAKGEERKLSNSEKVDLIKAEIAKTGEEYRTDEEIVEFAKSMDVPDLVVNKFLRNARHTAISQEELAKRAASLPKRGITEGELKVIEDRIKAEDEKKQSSVKMRMPGELTDRQRKDADAVQKVIDKVGMDRAKVKDTLVRQLSGKNKGSALDKELRGMGIGTMQSADDESRVNLRASEMIHSWSVAYGKKTDVTTRNKIGGIYTGSLADYDKPSLHKVGTGEGQQVYGYGLYGSNRRGVANHYAEKKHSRVTIDGRQERDIEIEFGRLEKSIKTISLGNLPNNLSVGDFFYIPESSRPSEKDVLDAKRYLKDKYGIDYDYDAYGYLSSISDELSDLMFIIDIIYDEGYDKGIESIKENKELYDVFKKHNVEKSKSILYEQTFFTNRSEGDESHLLSWYEPVSEENLKRAGLYISPPSFEEWIDITANDKYVRDRYARDGVSKEEIVEILSRDIGYGNARDNYEREIGSFDSRNNLTGEEVYNKVVKREGSPKAASKWLAEHDIDGIKYPADSYGSKTVKDGDKVGWNYVSFRDDNIRIDHKLVDGVQMYKTSVSPDQQMGKATLVTPEEDAAYADAVKRGDKETALKMIRQAAAKAMPNTKVVDEDGLPLVVYHGSNRFGETVFDKKLMMFTTDSKSRASGYGGPGFGSSRGFSRERSVEKFEPFDFENTDTVIRKANSVLGYNLHKATSDDLEKSFDELKKELSGFNDRVNSLQGFPDELTEEQLDFSNRIQSIAYAFGMEESEWKSLKDKIIDGSVKDYYLYNYLNREVRDIYDRYASLRNEYYDKMRNEMSEKGRKYLDEFFKGYDNADALIDAQYSFYNLLNPSNDIAREDGNIINRKLLVDEIINSYQSGIYSMFIDSGERQLVIDAKGAFWSNIEFNSKKMSTDSIGKWAKDNGYTSVRIDNVMDPGVQNAEGNDFITFSPSQVKSADITYDDNGDLIPLSQRFNYGNDDIRFKTDTDISDQLGKFRPLDDTSAFRGAKESVKAHGRWDDDTMGRVRKRDFFTKKEAEGILADRVEFGKLLEKAENAEPITDAEALALTMEAGKRIADGRDGNLTAEENEANEEGIDRAVRALVRGLSKAGSTLRMAQIGIDLRTRDSLVYMTEQLKANLEREDEKRYGVEGAMDPARVKERDEAVKKYQARISEMEKEMGKLHDVIEKQRKTIEDKERLADEKAVNKAFEDGRKLGRIEGRAEESEAEKARRLKNIDMALKFGANKELAEQGSESADALGDIFDMTKRFAGDPEAPLDDRMRKAFNDVLAMFDGKVDKAKAYLSEKYEGFASGMEPSFDRFVAEMDKANRTAGLNEKAKTERRKASSQKAAKESSKKTKKGSKVQRSLINAMVEANVRAEEAVDEETALQDIGESVRACMKLILIKDPDMKKDEVIGELVKHMNNLAEKSGLFGNGRFDEADVRDALLGREGFRIVNRRGAQVTLENLLKAKKMAEEAGNDEAKLKEAAKLAGFKYLSDAEILQELDRRIGKALNKRLNVLESRINEDEKSNEELRGQIKDLVMALRDVRSGNKTVGELLNRYLSLAEGMKDYRRQKSVLDRINSRVAMYQRKIANNDFEPAPKREAPDTAAEILEIQRAMRRLEKMRETYKNERKLWKIKRQPWLSRQFSSLFEILGEVKALAGSLDLSSVLRQGGQMTWAHPLLAVKNLRRTMDVLKSDEAADRAYDSIWERPNAPYYRKAGLDITTYGTNSGNAEDLYLLNKFRTITNNRPMKFLIGASERGFTMFLNLMRADVFDAMVKCSPYRDASKMDVETLKAIGKYINVASQRGNFDSESEWAAKVKDALPALNAVLWSPRNIISRIQFIGNTAKLLLPGVKAYGVSDWKARKMLARETGRYFLGVGAAIAFTKMMADLFRGDDEPPEDMVFDPRSSEFLQVKIGNTHLDFLSGLKPMVVFAARLKTGKTVNSRGQERTANAKEMIGNLIRSKFAPASGIIWDWYQGETFDRQDIVYKNPFKWNDEEMGIASFLFGQIAPLSIKDIIEQFGNNGPARGMLTTIYAMLGAGANTYNPNTYKQLKGDYHYYRRLWRDAETDEERRELVIKHPMLNYMGKIEAEMKVVRQYEKAIKDLTKMAEDARKRGNGAEADKIGKYIEDYGVLLEDAKKVAVNSMVGFRHPDRID